MFEAVVITLGAFFTWSGMVWFVFARPRLLKKDLRIANLEQELALIQGNLTEDQEKSLEEDIWASELFGEWQSTFAGRKEFGWDVLGKVLVELGLSEPKGWHNTGSTWYGPYESWGTAYSDCRLLTEQVPQVVKMVKEKLQQMIRDLEVDLQATIKERQEHATKLQTIRDAFRIIRESSVEVEV